MGAVAIGMNNTADIIAAGDRALNNALGVDGMRTYIDYYTVEAQGRPRITDEMIDEAIREGEAMIAKMSASVGGGRGNFTEDRHKKPQLSFEEVTERIVKTDAAERARLGAAL